jgi:hypothetical protein
MKARVASRMVGIGVVTALGVALVALAQPQGQPAEQEREVTEAEVPAHALAALKQQAGEARITEFAEEIEHGHTYYEGSWQGAHGHVDTLVTAAGDLVEIEEEAAEDAVPKAVLAGARQAAGGDAKLYFEKKTLILYEVKFAREGRRHELLFFPDGRTSSHEVEEGDEADEGN